MSFAQERVIGLLLEQRATNSLGIEAQASPPSLSPPLPIAANIISLISTSVEDPRHPLGSLLGRRQANRVGGVEAVYPQPIVWTLRKDE